jgi:hypothetical protein
MRRFSVVFAMIVFMISFVAGATLTAMPAAAQVGPASRTLINGQVLNWSDFYELDTTTVAVFDGIEIVDLYSATGWFSVISTNFPAYGNVLRDLSVQDLQTQIPMRQIDRGDYDNVSYSLDTTNYQGVEVGIFTLVLEQANYAQLTMIVAPVATFQYEMQISQAELAIAGSGVFKGVDPVVMQGHLTRATGVPLADLNAPTTTTVAVSPVNQANTGQTQAATTTGTTAQQPVNTGQTTTQTTQTTTTQVTAATSAIPVGGVQIGWSGAWTHDAANSSATQAMFSRIDQASGTIEMVSYGTFTDPALTSASAAIDAYTQAFFQGAGAQNVQQLDGGVLANGAEWRLYRYTLQGIDLATFVTGVASPTGGYGVTTVTANAPLLMFTLIDVQATFSVNGTTSLLDQVDPILVSLNLYA